jgi:hypothetical protein
MRKLLLAKTCLVAASSFGGLTPLYAQPTTTTAIITTPTAPRQDARNWAEKMLSEPRLEMGTVAKGTQVDKTLTVTNLYKEDVTITGVRTSCGCFKAAVVDNKNTLKTHDAATITVNMNTRDYRGQRDARLDVTFTFDGSTFKTVQVPLRGFIRTDVEIEPGYLNLGSIEHGQGTKRSVVVRFLGRQNAQIQTVKVNNPALKAETRERYRDYGRVEYDVAVTVDPSAQLGSLRDLLTVVTNDSSNPNLQLEVAGIVEPDYVVTPTVRQLGNLRPGVEKTVVVSIRGQRPFAIDKLERDSAVDCWKCKFAKEVKTVHTITLTMDPPEVPGDYTETFTVTIAGRKEPVTFKATGTIIAATPVAQDSK